MTFLQFVREALNKDLKLERLRKTLAEVNSSIEGYKNDRFFTMSIEEQTAFVEFAREDMRQAEELAKIEEEVATVRLGIKDGAGHYTDKFKKAVEANIGATEEEMKAHHFDSRFHRILHVLESELVAKDPSVMAFEGRAVDTRRKFYEAERKLQTFEDRHTDLEEAKRRLEGQIEYVLYLKMEKKAPEVKERIDALLDGKREFKWE